MRVNNIWKGVLVLVALAVLPYGSLAAPVTVDYTSQIQEKQQEIDALNKKIADLSAKRSTTASEADAIAITLDQLKIDLQRANTQLAKTSVQIKSVKTESVNTSMRVGDLEKQINEKKDELDALVVQLYEFEQIPLIQVFFDSQSLSDVFSQRDAYKALQQRAVGILSDMHNKQGDLKNQKDKLDQQAQDLTQLQALQNAQAQDLADKKSVQKQFLQQKKQQQARYDGLISDAQRVRDEIKNQVFTLQNGSVKISLNTANDMAKFAGKITGVRPALIMAVLTKETNVGTYLGSGVFPANMRENQRDAFLRITKALGIDPYKAPVSRGYPYGGAMGPAQFMPNTWEGLAGRVATLMHKAIANPYDLSDAFMATGLYLADKGAQDPAKEEEALVRYSGGSVKYAYDVLVNIAPQYEGL